MTQSITSPSSIKLIRRCGRVLIGVFVIAVTTSIFPLNLRSPDWGLGLSSNIVNSASLALVGAGLLRYSAFLELQALTEKDANPQIFHGSSGKESKDSFKKKALAKQKKIDFGIRRLALAGAISLLLLAAWQMILFFNGIDMITAQSLSASTRAEKQIEEVDLRIQIAPDQVIDAEWKKLQPTLPATSLTTDLDAATKRKQLLKEVKAQSQQARVTFQQKVAGSRFNLANNALRSFLMAIIYAWGFYGLHKL
jgi:hypothetical protein